MLEQHHAFDWMTRCFVARVDASRGLRKALDYEKHATKATAPLIVQGVANEATVVFRNEGGALQRVDCNSPAGAISAWIMVVEGRIDGKYSRKASVSDIVQRMKNESDPRAAPIPNDIGGARITVANRADATSS
jgi:hypothetical protein